MPGSGKTCMSRALSSKIDIKTLDTDRVIEARVGKKLHEIIAEQGLDEFRRIEEETLLTINEDNALLATGGSAVYYESAMKRFKEIGLVIYLYVSFETMLQRIGDYSKRGLVMRADQTIKDLYLERTALYEKYADVTINCDGSDYPKYRAELLKVIESHSK
jgi:shikimate kinase